jgi:hypothetical protein
MEYDTRLAAEYAGGKLDNLIKRAHRDTLKVVEEGDIPTLVKHFAAVRTEYRALKEKLDDLEKEVEELSYKHIPVAFANQNVKTIKLDDIGRVTVNQRWTASMSNKVAGMNWLRVTGNDGLIIETVNAQTLAAFAKTEALAGRPLPDETFTVGVAPYTSITKD